MNEERKKVSVESQRNQTTMEIEGEDGTKMSLKAGVKSVFGRGSGINTQDLTVSRRHVSFESKTAAAGTERSESDRVNFEVLGRNPVWVKTGEPGEKIRTLRKSETGEIAAGDRFCVSGHNPIWFTLKGCDQVMEERALDSESELSIIDISDTDPVKEFGFLVIGKEFEQYPTSRMRDVKQWEWFLEDSRNGNSDDDEDGGKKGRKGLSKKTSRKKGNEDDDDWSVESDEDKELIVKSKRVLTPTYSTRSKKKMKKDTNASCSSSSTQTKQRERLDFDDDDETLGGFIVSDEEEDESNAAEEEEEEDLDEDEDEAEE